jgi:ABC-2 type transport system ATP-binding protein
VIILDNGEIIFNQPSDIITEKLVFKVEDNNVDLKSVLYSEDNVRGLLVVKENSEHLESKLDIELLFNAIISNKKRIKEIFES